LGDEPDPEEDETDSSSTTEKANTDKNGYGGNVGIVVAVRLNEYFAIQSGANFNIDFKGPSKLQYTYLQVPVLMRADWYMPLLNVAADIGVPQIAFFIPSSVFGGLAFNVPISASSSAFGAEQTATMAIPMGGIIGAGWKIATESGSGLYLDLLYTFDFGKTKVTLADGRAGTFNRSSVDFAFGIKYSYIPFRR
jgi:hypothetical protein